MPPHWAFFRFGSTDTKRNAFSFPFWIPSNSLIQSTEQGLNLEFQLSKLEFSKAVVGSRSEFCPSFARQNSYPTHVALHKVTGLGPWELVCTDQRLVPYTRTPTQSPMWAWEPKFPMSSSPPYHTDCRNDSPHWVDALKGTRVGGLLIFSREKDAGVIKPPWVQRGNGFWSRPYSLVRHCWAPCLPVGKEARQMECTVWAQGAGLGNSGKCHLGGPSYCSSISGAHHLSSSPAPAVAFPRPAEGAMVCRAQP